MSTTPDDFGVLLPLACAWVQEQERLILRAGTPLTPSQIEDARKTGVSSPECVRVLSVSQIPMPEHPLLLAICETTKAITPRTTGLSVRYGIYVRSDRWGERELIVHELVHTAQYERLGGIEPFLAQYLRECVTVGYPQGPMEQEAIATAAKICASAPKDEDGR